MLDAARALLEQPAPPGRFDALEDALQERQEELRGRHGLEDRCDPSLALVGGAIRRLARSLVAGEAVEGQGARRARQERVGAGLAVAAPVWSGE